MPKSHPHPLARLDQRYVWHPFTQMRDWLRSEPIVVTAAQGAVLRDAHGREYLDGNASIWTNLHGHRHPRINGAIRRQLDRVAHTSALGLANEPASLLARRLVRLARPPRHALPPAPHLSKVFFSDDGSTAMEAALKLAYEFARRTRGSRRPRFLSLEGAYHGDTIGAVSLGHIDLFHDRYRGLLFPTDRVMAPYCYRCPYNRARPERADAREYRKCRWECLGHVERACRRQSKRGEPYAAFVVEPVLQGAAGMIPQPRGWLAQAAALAREHGALLIADEIMTAFGRVTHPDPRGAPPPLLACHEERVQPDMAALAKGLSGGYLPLAATLVRQEIFDAFLGRYDEFKTFFHGHSFTANQLGSAAALANLDLLEQRAVARSRLVLHRALARELAPLWALPQIGDIRLAGTAAGIELVSDWKTRRPFPLKERAGVRVCEALARRGVLTRPIGNVLVLMPPYCMSARQVRTMVQALGESIEESLPPA